MAIRLSSLLGRMAIFGLMLVVGLGLLGGPVEAADGDDATLAVSVTQDAQPVVGVVGDVFVANADGSRGTWLGDSQTGSDGSFDVVPFGTGPDGRLYFAAVDNPDADTRLRARLIRAPLDTETVIFDGVTFVDELHFSPDGNIYLRGFDGNETDLFAYQPACDPAAG